MRYADYDYYTTSFLEDSEPVVPETQFGRLEKQAELEMDALTHGRIALLTALPDKVKDCACAVTELLYQADTAAQGYLSQGMAGPLTSWSNDGQSGSVELGESIYTETGRRKEIRRLCSLYLGPLGLMYAGVRHYES